MTSIQDCRARLARTLGRAAIAGAVMVAAAAGTAAANDGPVNLLASGDLDLEAGAVTLPLQRGRMASGESVWYVLFDASDSGTAARLGINWSAKLANADVARAVRGAEISPEGELVFDSGTVDFRPERVVRPGAGDAPFPPAAAEPGSVGDDDYSPLVRVRNGGGHIFNAPMLAFDVDAARLDRFCDGDPDRALVHDKVVRICPRDGTVTLALTSGFSNGKRIEYVSVESSAAVAAALEGATLAPRLADVAADRNDAPWSAVEPIYVVVNGRTGADAADRQGLVSALADGLPPLNVAGDVPTLGDGYSPLWASHPVVWADDALDRRILITSEAEVRELAMKGMVHGPDGAAIGADGIVVNCPAVTRLE